MNETQSQFTPQDVHIGIENCLLKALKSTDDFLDSKTNERIRQKVEEINSTDTALSAIQFLIFTLVNKLEVAVQSTNFNLKAEDYEVLEQSLQKAEAEIRKHIRLEQQLKLYMDGLEEKVEELQNSLKFESDKYHQLFESTKVLNYEKRELEKKLKSAELREKSHAERDNRTSKILLAESSDYSMHNNPYYVPRADKYKLLQKKKSNDKHSQILRGNHQSQKKILDNEIQVSLKDGPKRRNLQKQSKQIKQQLMKTVQLKDGPRRNSRKFVRHQTDQSQIRSKKDIRCSSVCS